MPMMAVPNGTKSKWMAPALLLLRQFVKKREIDMKFKLRVVQCLTLLVSLGTGGETEEPDTVHKYQRI